MHSLKRYTPGALVHIGSLFPLALLIWNLTQGQLGVNPIEQVQLRTGTYAMIWLILTLACTPAADISGVKRILAFRRTFGLYAFMYAGLHFLNFLGVDYGFDFSLIRADLAEKYFILVGFVAFLLLLPLAITSTRGWRRRLGRRWGYLHWLVYPAAIIAVSHFVWQEKADIREPLIYGGAVFLLLVARIPVVRKAISRRGRPGTEH
jgi:sulfoxide reductase heme-binding subunit YedZ